MNNIKTIFFTCTVRSGAALLTRMLSTYPKVKISSGTLNFFRFFYNRYKPLKRERNYKKLIYDASYRLLHRFGIKIDQDEILNFLRKKGVNYSNLYLAISYQIFKKQNPMIVGDQEGNAWNYIPNYFTMFPKGRVIILLRDPRDIVCSFRKTTIAKKNDYLISLFNSVDVIKKAYKYKKKYKSKIQIVKFHDLKQNPKKELIKLCKFLKISFNKDMLNPKKYKDVHGNKWDANKPYSFRGKLRKLTINRWKKIINNDDLFLCEWIAKKQIQKLGLELSNKKFLQKDCDKAIKKINSSKLLKSSFEHWYKTGNGVQKYPLDPINPKYWDKKSVKNYNAFKKYKIL